MDNGVSAQVAMSVVRQLEDEEEREYQATNPNQIEEVGDTDDEDGVKVIQEN